MTVPPPPGLAAHIANHRVEVEFDTGTPPSTCRPKVIRILFDDDDYQLPPVRVTLQLHRLGKQTVSLAIPTWMRSNPTSILASTGYAPEFRGPDSRAKITP